MHFTCEKEELNAALNLVQRAIPARSTMNVLEGIYLSATENQVLLRCSDLTLQIETKIPALVYEDGSVVLGKLFLEMVRHMAEGSVDIQSEGENSVQVSSGRSKMTLQTMDVEDYPVMPELRAVGEVVLPRPVLKDMIRQTVFSTAVDENKPILTGALLEMSREGVNMVALDGYRLALRRYAMPCAEEKEIVLPAKSLNEISRILGEEGEVKLCYGSGYASIELENIKICTQLLNGEYTKYRQIIKEEHQTRVKVNRAELLNSIERASIMARETRNNLIKFNINPETIVVTSNSEIGKAYDEVPVVFEGKELDIAFNSRYLTDVFKVLSDEELYLDFNSNVSPCTVRPVDSDAFLYLVLPVRVYG